MVNLLLISLTLLATCFFGFWQMLLAPRRAVLQSLLGKVNKLLTSHEMLLRRYNAGGGASGGWNMVIAQSGDWGEVVENFGKLYESIFLDVSISANKDLPEKAKAITAKYRALRTIALGPISKYRFTEALLNMHNTPVALEFEKLSVLIEYAIKKMPYRFFPYSLFRPLMRRLMPTREPSSRRV